MELSHPLAHALQTRRKWTDPLRERTTFTALLLIGDEAAISARNRGHAPDVDSRLVLDLYAASRPEERTRIFDSAVTISLEPTAFRKLFTQEFSRTRSATRLGDIAFTLVAFLRRHPEKAAPYAPFIRSLLPKRAERAQLASLLLLGSLDDLSKAELGRLRDPLVSTGAGDAITAQRMNALNAVCNLLKRSSQLSPRVLSFCTSPELRAHYRRLHREDPSSAVRLCAHYVLKALKALRR